MATRSGLRRSWTRRARDPLRPASCCAGAPTFRSPRRPPEADDLMRKLFLVAVSVALTACSSSGVARTPVGPGGPKGLIVVGVSGAFTENQLVAEMYA